MEDQLIAAIDHRFVVTFTYEGRPRTVNPHALIRADRGGRTILHGWQVDGSSNTRRPPCWGNFDLARIRGLTVLDEPFGRPQPDFNTTHFLHVIHSL